MITFYIFKVIAYKIIIIYNLNFINYRNCHEPDRLISVDYTIMIWIMLTMDAHIIPVDRHRYPTEDGGCAIS